MSQTRFRNLRQVFEGQDGDDELKKWVRCRMVTTPSRTTRWCNCQAPCKACQALPTEGWRSVSRYLRTLEALSGSRV